MITHNTVLVLTAATEHKSGWAQQVFQLNLRARGENDAKMVALTEAVQDLLRGKPLEEITADLSGPHAECWETYDAKINRQGKIKRQAEG